jgi:hypothetical protein
VADVGASAVDRDRVRDAQLATSPNRVTSPGGGVDGVSDGVIVGIGSVLAFGAVGAAVSRRTPSGIAVDDGASACTGSSVRRIATVTPEVFGARLLAFGRLVPSVRCEFHALFARVTAFLRHVRGGHDVHRAAASPSRRVHVPTPASFHGPSGVDGRLLHGRAVSRDSLGHRATIETAIDDARSVGDSDGDAAVDAVDDGEWHDSDDDASMPPLPADDMLDLAALLAQNLEVCGARARARAHGCSLRMFHAFQLSYGSWCRVRAVVFLRRSRAARSTSACPCRSRRSSRV